MVPCLGNSSVGTQCGGRLGRGALRTIPGQRRECAHDGNDGEDEGDTGNKTHGGNGQERQKRPRC